MTPTTTCTGGSTTRCVRSSENECGECANSACANIIWSTQECCMFSAICFCNCSSLCLLQGQSLFLRNLSSRVSVLHKCRFPSPQNISSLASVRSAIHSLGYLLLLASYKRTIILMAKPFVACVSQEYYPSSCLRVVVCFIRRIIPSRGESFRFLLLSRLLSLLLATCGFLFRLRGPSSLGKIYRRFLHSGVLSIPVLDFWTSALLL